MDRKLIEMPDRANPIEFCDLYTARKEMIHVKRYGGSAPLSHLFAQGMVSGTAFYQDAAFRMKVNRLLPRSHRVSGVRSQLKALDYSVIFAIASRSEGPLVLPFFSKVNLRNAHRQLTNLGFDVALVKIRVVPPGG